MTIKTAIIIWLVYLIATIIILKFYKFKKK